jgi:hypothetical protein
VAWLRKASEKVRLRKNSGRHGSKQCSVWRWDNDFSTFFNKARLNAQNYHFLRLKSFFNPVPVRHEMRRGSAITFVTAMEHGIVAARSRLPESFGLL